MMLVVFIICSVLPILLSAAFMTLFERKLIGFSQYRQGPNIVGFWGVFQPVADGIKLLIKEYVFTSKSVSYVGFVFVSMIPISVMVSIWMLCTYPWMIVSSSFSIIVFFVISSFSIYGFIGAGFITNSKYSFIGGMRAAAQFISYEVSMSTLIIIVMFYMISYEIGYSCERSVGVFSLPFVCFWFFISIMAETARAPFDLMEGESELVSGYNVEYSSVMFTFFFLGEYGMMVVMCMIFVQLFIGNFFFFFFVLFFFMYGRVCYPRMRYDQIMDLNWKIILPSSIGFVSYVCFYMMIVYFLGIFY